MRELYEQFHGVNAVSDWERTSSGKFRAWVALIEKIPRGLLLDVGCGDGSITERLSSLTQSIPIGLDLSFGAVRKARSAGIGTIACDVSQGIPLRPESVDHVFSSDLLEHLVDVDYFLEEIWRILKPGGYCILSTPNLAWLPNRLLLLVGLQPFWMELSYKFEISGLFAEKRKFPAGHIHVFTVRALVTLLRFHGFTVERVRGANMIEPKTLKRWRFPAWVNLLTVIDALLSLCPSWAAEVVVKVRKPPMVKLQR